MGGDCLNVGCVPSKGMIEAARLGGPEAGDFGAVMERVRRIRADLSSVDSAQRFTGLGVDVFLGQARFGGLLGDRIGVLLGGTLAQLDAPERLFRSPASLPVARFLGIPNLVPGSVADGRFCSLLGPVAVEAKVLPGPATAAFGADALHVHPRGSLRGVVRGVQHGPRGITLRIEIAGLTLLAMAPPEGLPHAGDELALALEAERMTVLPGV